MGISLKPVMFFSDAITIDAHTASLAEHCGATITLRQFAGRQRMKLDQVLETGEFIATRADGCFIQGAEACGVQS